MKRIFAAVLLIMTLSPMAFADYLEASMAEQERAFQLEKQKQAADNAAAAAIRERIYRTLSDSFAKAHGGYNGEIKPFTGPQLSSQIYEAGAGIVNAEIIFQFSTRDGFECLVAESFYLIREKYQNSASIHCIHPDSGKHYDKTVPMKGIRPELI